MKNLENLIRLVKIYNATAGKLVNVENNTEIKWKELNTCLEIGNLLIKISELENVSKILNSYFQNYEKKDTTKI